MDKGTGEIVAIKIIAICDDDSEDELKKIVREIDHLKRCDSPYVTAYYGSYYCNKRLWVRSLPSFFLRFRSFLHKAGTMGSRRLASASATNTPGGRADCDGVLFGRQPQEDHEPPQVAAFRRRNRGRVLSGIGSSSTSSSYDVFRSWRSTLVDLVCSRWRCRWSRACITCTRNDYSTATSRPVWGRASFFPAFLFCCSVASHPRTRTHTLVGLRADNILLNSKGSAKLADLGVATQMVNTMDKHKTATGTPYWMVPIPPRPSHVPTR